jgi:hypothetical protein
VKSRNLVGLALAAMAAGALLLALQQRRELAALRATRVLEPVIVPAAVRTNTPAVASPGRRLSEAEHLELLRFRGQIKPLAERVAGVAVLSNQNVRLQARLAAARATPAFPPEGYIRRADAQNRGTATPESVIETFIWATGNRDTNALLSCLVAPMRESMARQLAEQGADEFFKNQLRIPGFRIVDRKDDGPDEVTLTVEFGPGLSTPMKFRRQDGAWVMEP